MKKIVMMCAMVAAAMGAWAEYTDDCITFSSAESFTLKTANTSKNWDGTLWTSTDKTNWTEWSGAEVSAAQTGGTYNLYVRGNADNTVITGDDGGNFPSLFRWILTGSTIACTGNIETLRGATGNNPSPTRMADYCYYFIFYGCTALTNAPELPATTLARRCYSWMFGGCTALTKAPALPATTLVYSCYSAMFSDCTALTNAPELPATTLADDCYCGMFQGCTALTAAPALPAATLALACYSIMFQGCTALMAAPALPATTLAKDCYSEMFGNCTALKDAPALPATTLATECYRCMFYGCTALIDAPALPATTLADFCYDGMFWDCTALKDAPVLPATMLARYCYSGMFMGCTSLEVNAVAPGKEWKIPAISTTASNWGTSMFYNTAGTLQGQPALNTTYYIKSDPEPGPTPPGPVPPGPEPEPEEGFEEAHTFNGLAYADEVMCGIVQVTTGKRTAKDQVKVGGFVMLTDGKKQTIKSVTEDIEGGKVYVETKAGKLGDVELEITDSGFTGSVGLMTVKSGDIGEDTGIISGTLKMSYFDAKTNKLKTRSIKLGGVASEGEAAGTLDTKGEDTTLFEAAIYPADVAD